MMSNMNVYIPIADRWFLYDNSFGDPAVIAEKEITSSFRIINRTIWNKLHETYR